MPTITLAEPWTYRTPLLTVRYEAGEHDVIEEVAASAPTALKTEQEADDGNRNTAASAPRRSRKAKG